MPFRKKGQIRSIDEQWPAADFGIGKLCCIRDGKGVGGKEKEYLRTYSVSIGENRPLGSVAGSPVSDCNKPEEDAEERSYRGDGLLIGNSPDRVPISGGKGIGMPNLEDSESEGEEETEMKGQEEIDSESDAEDEQNISKIQLCSNHFCVERRCSHDRSNTFCHIRSENVKDWG